MVKLSPEVREALERDAPVVALESTIISHGMPYPRNLETARKVEETVRRNGAVPATIAVIGGRITAGLSEEELDLLARPPGPGEPGIVKASRRDLAVIMAGGMHAATTVAATMICADLAGIRIFATGGVGGVHRGAGKTFDISADLQELARTDVTVVSAGVKSILDIGLTLEYLETMGVPVIGYRTDTFPAFYTRESGHRVAWRLDSPGEVAAMLRAKRSAGLSGGVLLANPISGEDAMDPSSIEAVIDRAVREADERGIQGKELTPYLLARIVELTGGESLEANISLVLNNARLAAQVAVEFARQERQQAGE